MVSISDYKLNEYDLFKANEGHLNYTYTIIKQNTLYKPITMNTDAKLQAVVENVLQVKGKNRKETVRIKYM